VLLNSDSNSEAWFEIAPFDPFATYEISFDYEFKKGEPLEVLLAHDNDFGDENIFKRLSKDPYDHEAKNETLFVSPRSGASQMSLGFRVKPFNACPPKKIFFVDPCQKKRFRELFEKRTEVSIKNIRVRKAFDNQIVLLKENFQEKLQTPETTFIKIDPTHYKIKIKEAKNPFILVFSELFNSGWELLQEDGSKIPDDKHFLVNGFSNAWLIEKPGDYELTLRLAAQELLDKGKIVSLVSIFAFLVFLGLLSWRRKY